MQRERNDDRIDRARTFELDLGRAADHETIRWRIEYQRVLSVTGDLATVADRVVVASGELEEGPTSR